MSFKITEEDVTRLEAGTAEPRDMAGARIGQAIQDAINAEATNEILSLGSCLNAAFFSVVCMFRAAGAKEDHLQGLLKDAFQYFELNKEFIVAKKTE